MKWLKNFLYFCQLETTLLTVVNTYFTFPSISIIKPLKPIPVRKLMHVFLESFDPRQISLFRAVKEYVIFIF